MTLQPVENSSNIEAVGHAGEELRVRFKNGRTYVYAGVPAEVHALLMAAESKGAYFAKQIRPQFAGTLLPEEKPEETNAGHQGSGDGAD